jgi:hypothetical protein
LNIHFVRARDHLARLGEADPAASLFSVAAA